MPILLGSITDLVEDHRGEVVVAGSHCGELTGWHASTYVPAALICHDAGVGLDAAGIAGLKITTEFGIAAACVSHSSACIGDPEDMLRRGRISHINTLAGKAGVCSDMSVVDAVQCLKAYAARVGNVSRVTPSPKKFSRQSVAMPDGGFVLLLDSASLMSPDDDGAIVITGSHGGLPGSRSDRALRAQPYFVAFNDAGVGIDDAGVRRLEVLERQGVAAICVGAGTAKIGDARSTLETGIVSFANSSAIRLGARTGAPLRPLVEALAAQSAVPSTSSDQSKVSQ